MSFLENNVFTLLFLYQLIKVASILLNNFFTKNFFIMVKFLHFFMQFYTFYASLHFFYTFTLFYTNFDILD